MALTGLDFKKVAAWLIGAPAESEQVALWGKWDGHLLWGRWGSQERRGHEASHDPAKGHWRAPASRLASRCAFQGGSVLGDWHQQDYLEPCDVGPRQGLPWALLGSGALMCIESRCCREALVQPNPAQPSTGSTVSQFIPRLVFLGGGEMKGKMSYKLFSHNQAFKNSLRRGGGATNTTHFLELRHPETETSRQADPHPYPGHLTPCSHSSRVSLLFSPP